MNTLVRRSFVLLLVSMLVSLALPVHAQGDRRVDQGAAALAAYNLPPESFVELSAYASNPQKLAETLIKYGYTPEQAQEFITPQNVMMLEAVLNPSPSQELLGQAMAILGPYNLSMTDLEALFPKLTDPQAMAAALMEKGLTQEQALKVLQDAAPLIQEASTSGLLQYTMLTGQIDGMLNQIGLNSHTLFSAAPYLNDPEALAAFMQGQGYTADQIQAFQGVAAQLAAQGITGETLDGWTAKSLIYRLEGLGLEPGAVNDILALGDPEAIRAHLEELGYEGGTLELAMTNITGIVGNEGESFTAERLANFQANEAQTLLEGAGVDMADLGYLLELRGDPEALGEYLSETYGMTDEQIAAFESSLDRTTFAQTVDPEDAEDFAAEVEMSLEDESEMGDDSEGDDVSDDSADDTADDTAEDDAGDDSADDASDGSAEDTGGDDAGGDDGGGDDGGGADDAGGDGGGDDAGGDEGEG
ncbi:MAG: hypothetical protein HY866_02405 [Chloroflexi bacterium]|nr:hypothetical protein [Chloroflexota bacterium]